MIDEIHTHRSRDLRHSARHSANGMAQHASHSEEQALRELPWALYSPLEGFVEQVLDALHGADHEPVWITDHIESQHEYIRLLDRLARVMSARFGDELLVRHEYIVSLKVRQSAPIEKFKIL